MQDPSVAQDNPVRTPSRLRRFLTWKLLIPGVLFALLLFSPLIWRQLLLSRVPDIGDPFSIADLLEPIPAEMNAYPLFARAYALRVPVADEDVAGLWEQRDDGWDSTDDLLNVYLELNRPALEKWREATERDDFQVAPKLTGGDDQPDYKAHRDLTRWCQFEIQRFVETGSAAEALPWLRASFRASALVTRNGPWASRMLGEACYALSIATPSSGCCIPILLGKS